MSGSVAYGWDSCEKEVRRLVNCTVQHFVDTLGYNLVGIYLHGSLAMGCFNPMRSDLDVIAVSHEPLSLEQKKASIEYLLSTHSMPPAKGIEISVVHEDCLKPLRFPVPYELHYSNDWFGPYSTGQVDLAQQRYDEDLPAHFMIIRTRGICLKGRRMDTLFPVVPHEIYLKSILADARLIFENIERDPLYTALNLCRILAYAKERLITSKKEGAEWALRETPKYFHSLVERALAAYTGTQPFVYDTDALRHFVDFAREELTAFNL